MVQIIPANPTKQSFSQKLAGGIGRGLEIGSQLYGEHQQKQLLAKEKQGATDAILQLTGKDTSGLPLEMQKEYLSKALQGQNEQAKQQSKYQSQLDLMKQLGLNLGEEEENEPTQGQRFEKKQPKGILKPGYENLASENKRAQPSKLIPENKIQAMALINPAVADKMQKHNDNIMTQQRHEEDIEQKNQEIKQTSFQKDREFHSKTSLPIIENSTKIVQSAPAKKGLINQHRRDIASGNVSGYRQFLVDKTGWEIFRTPEAARARSAAKQYFMESLNSLANGARPNIFIEQQLSAGQTQIGREEEANQSVLDIMEFRDDLELQRAKFILEEAKKDEEKYGYARNDVDRRAEEKMIPYAEQREDEMAYTIRKRTEESLTDEDIMKDIYEDKIGPSTPLTPRVANILRIKNNEDLKKAQAEAKRLGFIFPTETTINKIK